MHLPPLWTFRILKTFLRVTKVLKLMHPLIFLTLTFSWILYLVHFLTWIFSWIFTLIRSDFLPGHSHESLLHLVHMVDVDIFMNHYFISFTFFLHGHSQDTLLYLVHISDKDTLICYYFASFISLTWMFPWIITLPRSCFDLDILSNRYFTWLAVCHGHSHELLRYLVHSFDMDVLMTHYFTSFMFLTRTLSWIITLPGSHFWQGYSHESLLCLLHVSDMDILMMFDR